MNCFGPFLGEILLVSKTCFKYQISHISGGMSFIAQITTVFDMLVSVIVLASDIISYCLFSLSEIIRDQMTAENTRIELMWSYITEKNRVLDAS